MSAAAGILERPVDPSLGRPAVEFLATVPADGLRRYMPDNCTYLLPASSYARFNFRKPALPAHITRWAADCGGFVATRINGGYTYGPATYVDWLLSAPTPPLWAAMMDYCCEQEVAGTEGIVRARQQWTTDMARHFIQEWGWVPWAWAPTIQGWETADYVRHARQLAPLIRQLQSFYYHRPEQLWDAYDGDDEPEGLAQAEQNMMEFRVGIGTLCNRASVEQIHEIVQALTAELPGVKFHLWGVKLGALTRPLPASVVSVDSAAWNGRFGTDIELQKNSGMTQREYGFKVALPRYLAKVDAALGQWRPASSVA